MTFKQLEAVYWVTKLGGFSPAAQRLHTTQSAISKRVQELEALFDVPIFDRSARSVRLTDKGEEMFAVAERLLRERDQATERFQKLEVTERRLRIGVTELTAMTWFPKLVSLIHDNFPRVAIEPDVDSSVTLRDKLLADELDLAIIPEVPDDTRVMRRAVGKVENVWMCKPGQLDANKIYRVHELANHLLLTQGSRSGTGLTYERWFKSFGISPTKTIPSNNLIAIIAMTVSGLGISFLPRECMRPIIDAGLLSIVRVTPALPEINYVAIFKGDQHSSLVASIVLLAQECCDFGRALNTSG
ncbi:MULTISPECIES: LysR family transcriptional regulator [unclassified Variovorax]|uniref:LysR family transcriptional regulator n=1 Tax=unclassified Variovorax TaxID=663243 RepID=UPI003F46C145